MLRARTRVSGRVVAGWLLAGGILATTLVGACADKKGGLMLAVNTDMRAPKDVNAVSVTISTNGAIKHSFIGRVTPQGEVLLPATLAIVQPDDPNATIRVRVVAFQERKPRVLRDVRTTVPTGGRTALLRIPLNFINDASAVGPTLPPNIIPDPFPGTGGGTPSDADAGDNSGAAFGSSAGDFDFLNAWHSPCSAFDSETIIDGECKDSYVDPNTLPDFDSSQLGDSTDQGSCFDLAKCFAASAPVADGALGADGGTSSGGSADASAPAPTDGGGSGGDGGGGKFKDFTTRAVALDRATCTLQLNGADAKRLNVAIVTPDTGECVRPGECYVPIDQGPNGWKEESGRVQLPSFVCKLLNGKNLRLATSTDTCAAKQESNPICTPKPGDPIGIADSGPAPATNDPVRVVPEDFATSVVSSNGTLFFAAASRVGRLDLAAPTAVGTTISGIATAGTHLPWRFASTQGGGTIPLANGSAQGFVVNQSSANSLTFPNGAIDVASIQSSVGQLAWVVRSADPTSTSIFVSGLTGAPTQLTFPTTSASTIVSGPTAETLLVGGFDGTLRTCTFQPMPQCYAVSNVPRNGRIEAFAPKFGAPTSGYALGANGIYGITVNGPSAPVVTDLVAGDLSGLDEGGFHFARAMAVTPTCVLYSSKDGISALVDAGGGTHAGFSIVPPLASGSILGVALGPSPGKTGESIYYTVYAPREQGGGIWRVPVPQQCQGASGSDGGTSVPPDASVPQCGPGNCPMGCCTAAGMCLDFPAQNTNACGANGAKCQDCALIPASCAPMGQVGGICGG